MLDSHGSNCPLILLLLLSNSLQAPEKISFTLGEGQGGQPGFPVSAFPDISKAQTMISPIDFLCVEERGCSIESETRSEVIDGRNVAFRFAKVKVGLSSSATKEKIRVMYLESDPWGLGSVVGLGEAGEYLRGLRKGSEFSLAAGNTPGDSVPEPPLLRVKEALNGQLRLSSSPGVAWEARRVCLSNSADRNGREVFFVVSQDELTRWVTLVSSKVGEAALRTPDRLHLLLGPKGAPPIGSFRLDFTELLVDGAVAVSSFDPSFDDERRCDMYTGTLFLKKFNFTFFCSEKPSGFEALASLGNFSPLAGELDEDSFQNSTSTWIKVLIFLAILAVAGYFVYHYIYAETKDGDEYNMQHNIKHDIELKKVEEADKEDGAGKARTRTA